MRKKEINNLQIGLLFIISIFSLMIISISYGHWEENVEINSYMTVGSWDTRIEIIKTLDGIFTDPDTGDDFINMKTDLIAIGANFPTKFRLTITVENCESTEIINIIITDQIDTAFIPIQTNPEDGTVTWDSNIFEWIIPYITPNGYIELVIDLQTTFNYDYGAYEPICNNCQLQIDNGGTFYAEAGETVWYETPFEANMDAIIVDISYIDNGIGKIIQTLPYSIVSSVDNYSF
jgi:hypothetical protein